LEVGLTTNEKKTKYLKCAKKYIKIENLNIKSSYIELVKQYKYLGSIIVVGLERGPLSLVRSN